MFDRALNKFLQKQLSEGVLWKRCSKKFRKIHKKTPAPKKKETLAQVFSCEFYEISKNTFFYRTPPVAASLSDLDIFLGSLK